MPAMSSSERINHDERLRDMDRSQINDHHFSGMTESIITTINNADPTLPIDDSITIINSGGISTSNVSATNNHNDDPSAQKIRRNLEPCYESYIEDSFVGHWETEEDDPIAENRSENGKSCENGTEEDESALHPSTIEFDFDSFGPESFIYTPPSSSKQSQVVIDQAIVQQETPSNQRRSSDESALSDTSVNKGAAESVSKSTHNRNYHHSISPIDNLVESAQIDLRVIEPYKKVISHAGYCHYIDSNSPPPIPGEPAPAVIVFSACYLPDRSRRDYDYVMDHLFLYVLSSLHELIADDYILIYLHNAQPSTFSNFSFGSSLTSSSSGTATASVRQESNYQNNLPTFTWMKRCYQMIDRKLRKNLRILYLVKPTLWLKTIVIMCKPFISSKFSKKLHFVENMEELRKCLPVDKLILPASADNL